MQSQVLYVVPITSILGRLALVPVRHWHHPVLRVHAQQENRIIDDMIGVRITMLVIPLPLPYLDPWDHSNTWRKATAVTVAGRWLPGPQRHLLYWWWAMLGKGSIKFQGLKSRYEAPRSAASSSPKSVVTAQHIQVRK
jgi:hypothetical protein